MWEQVKHHCGRWSRRLVHLAQVVRVFVASKHGVSTVEYALITLAVIGIVAGGITILGGQFESLWSNLGGQLSAAVSALASI